MRDPAVKAAVNDYPIGVFTSVFTGRELFLADHIIQEKKILPGMAYLEIARAAIANSVTVSENQIIVLSDSIFVSALVITEKRSVEVKVYPGAKGEFGVEVSTDQGVHFQTKAVIQNKNTIKNKNTIQNKNTSQNKQERTDSHFSPIRLDIARLQQQCTNNGPTKQAFYASFKERGVNLGPSHRGVEDIKLGQDCAFVKISLPGSSQRGAALDPGMLDSVIQGGVALASNSEANVVPFAVKKTTIFGALTDDMFVYIVKTDQGLDYTVADNEGEVRVIINGFLTREIDLNAQTDQLVFYKPSWQDDDLNNNEIDNNKNITLINQPADYASLVKSVFNTAKNLIQNKVDEHTIEVQVPANKPSWQGIIAALKTVSLEYPKIAHRLKVDDKSIKLGYTSIDMTKAPAYSWPDNKVILITGGLGAIAKLVAQDVAANSKGCSLILVGRNELQPEKAEFIAQIESLGTKVIYIQCDVSDQRQVDDLLVRFANINGVIHTSGTLQDNTIVKKTLDEIDKVLAPKVLGLEFIDKATKNIELDYFVVFSSVAGTLGNNGQLDYAAANAYMDAYIHHRAQQVKNGERSGKSISINWPLWDSGGMQVDESIKQNLLQVFKIKPLPSAQGLVALKKIIASDHEQLIVVFGNRKAISPMFNSKNGFDKSITSIAKAHKKTVNVEGNKLSREILQQVRIQTAEHLKLKPNQLDDTADWAAFGFDSILLSSFANRINTRFDLNLMPTIMFEATNIQLFSQYLAENHLEHMAKKLSVASTSSSPSASSLTNTLHVSTMSIASTLAFSQEQDHEKINAFAQGFKKSYKSSVAYRQKDIAIVGMSCRIAGARTPDEFWKMLDEEKDMISEIPEDRWNWKDYPGVSKWGSFIEGAADFDSLFFGISPAEAMYMNPEQRLMMQYVWECLENAGCGGDDVKGNNTGLFMGCGPSGYSYFLNGLPIEAYSATGTVSSVGPNRISYLMDWHGPSNPIDTACSSALVAVHRAVEAIRGGHCEAAIAGGVNLLLSPDGYISFSKSGMLCEDGKCKTFSNKANGYVRGEGIGMLMLKPLEAAIRDGNVIHALVKGTAENHGGRTNSLTAPNPKSQAAVIKKAISEAGIDFTRMSYIECHGTGTSLGDPVEISGLKTVAADLLEDKNHTHICKLGSIKSNIGHLEYAAGAVGLIKVILQMKHKKIAKSLHCNEINPYIDLKGTPYQIAQEASDWWVEEGQTRVAGVSSFGFGGVNAHIVLEEYQEGNSISVVEDDSLSDTERSHILIFSARSEAILMEYLAQFPAFIKTLDKTPVALKDIAYTLQIGRAEMQERVVFVANSINDWAEQLDKFLEEKGKTYSRSIHRGTVNNNASSNVELADTEAGKHYIRQLIQENELEKVAELWVKGTKIDWQGLHC
jgi:acyl transferase domain-containing protein